MSDSPKTPLAQTKWTCDVCNCEYYYSYKSIHLRTMKHKKKVAAAAQPSAPPMPPPEGWTGWKRVKKVEKDCYFGVPTWNK